MIPHYAKTEEITHAPKEKEKANDKEEVNKAKDHKEEEEEVTFMKSMAKSRKMKGLLPGDNFLWVVVAILVVLYLVKYLPFDLKGTVGASPIAFLLPSINFAEGISLHEISAPIGAICLVIVILMFIKKN